MIHDMVRHTSPRGEADTRLARIIHYRDRHRAGIRRGQGSSSDFLLGFRIMPASVRHQSPIDFRWTPAAGFVYEERRLVPKDGIDHTPGGLHRILSGKQGAIAHNG